MELDVYYQQPERVQTSQQPMLRRWTWACYTLIVMAIVAEGSWLFAASGSVVRLPQPGTKNRSGLALELDTRWVSGMGYRPVRVRVVSQPFGPSPSDRTIQVTLRAIGWGAGATKQPSVTFDVELKQGDTIGETIVSIPQIGVWNSMSIETREDGWRHRDLSVEYIGLVGYINQVSPDNVASVVVVHWAADDRLSTLTGGSMQPYKSTKGKHKTLYIEPYPCAFQGTFVPLMELCTEPKTILTAYPGRTLHNVISVDQLPDIRALAGCFPENYSNIYGTNALGQFDTTTPASAATIRRLTDDLPNFDLLTPHLLPDHWRDLTNIDVLVVSRDDLQGLHEQFPEKLEAIRTWLRSGTTLCVYDAGEDFQYCGEIDELLNVTSLSDESNSAGEVKWNVPSVAQFSDTLESTKPVGGGLSWLNQQRIANSGGVLPTTPSTPPAKHTFEFRNVGQGTLVAIAAENPFPGRPAEWNWIFNTIPSRKLLAYQRHGVSHVQDNMQFWNFLIENIGRAPVKTFLFMISLFAVIIGPINYMTLHRRGRLYLLLVTVPLGAVIVSGGLFAFAMFADGLGSRVRLRSYTELDQSTGSAMSWSRQSYYSGFAPSRGLSFAANAIVLPIEHRPVSTTGSPDTSRAIVWSENQDLTRGYLNSREVAQFLVVEPVTTELGIRIQPLKGGAGYEVTNELQVPLTQLVFQDEKRDMYRVMGLAASKTAEAEKIQDLAAVASEWGETHRANRPKFPVSFDPTELDDVSQFFASRSWRLQTFLAAPMCDTSVMENAIGDALTSDFKSLLPRQYIAILPRSPFVSVGLESISEESGFHVLKGRW